MRRIATTTPMTMPTMAPVSRLDPLELLLLAGGATVTVEVGDVVVVCLAKMPDSLKGRVLVGVGAMIGPGRWRKSLLIKRMWRR